MQNSFQINTTQFNDVNIEKMTGDNIEVGIIKKRSRNLSFLMAQDSIISNKYEEAPEPKLRKKQKSQSVATWKEKSPLLALGSMAINRGSYPVNEIGKGVYHKVFEFTNEGEIIVGERTFKTEEVVLKILNPLKFGSQNKMIDAIATEMKAYEELIKNKINVAEIYVDPMTFIDSENPKNGRFWLVEKLPYEVPGYLWADGKEVSEVPEEGMKILDWVKKYLTEMAVNTKDLINDFRIRNTRLDRGKEPKIIDYSPSEKDKWEIEYNITRYANDWANGNKKIFDYLISDFPEQMKQKCSFENEQV